MPVDGDDEPALGRACGKSERLSTGRRAGVENQRPDGFAEEEHRQLGCFVLNPKSTRAERPRALRDAGNDAQRPADETARLDQDPVGVPGHLGEVRPGGEGELLGQRLRTVLATPEDVEVG